MKINEILVESQQLDEGPLDAVGRAAGKVAGGAAKAVGAVAGGVAGLGKAFMKGYKGGKDTVSGDDEAGDAAPAAGGDSGAPAAAGGAPAPAADSGAPAAAPKAKAKPQSTFGKLTKAAAGGAEEPAAAGGAAPADAGATPAPAAKTTAPAAGGTAPAKQPAAQDQGAGGTAYAQAQKAVQSLPPEQQKEIVTMLQADPKVKAAMEKPAAPKQKAAAPSAGAFGAMAKQLGGEKPAAEPAAATSSTGGTTEKTPGGVKHTANPNNPNAAKPAAAPAAEPAAPAAGEKPGFLKTATDKIRDKKKTAKPSQAEIDADRERIMGVTSDSIIRKGLMVSESFSFFRKR